MFYLELCKFSTSSLTGNGILGFHICCFLTESVIKRIKLHLSRCVCVTLLQIRRFFFIQKIVIFFLFLHENICCGYSLEVPRRGTSNEYQQRTFSCRNNKSDMLIFYLGLCVMFRTCTVLDLKGIDTLLSFQHLLESRFLPGAVHRISKFANFCHDLMQNHLS